MNTLEVMTNLNKVIPYFQAIFSADSHTIIGYEVLARIETDDGIVSLGPFFHDPTIPMEFSLEVDAFIHEKALEIILNNKENVLLFLNVNANYVMIDNGEGLLSRLLTFRERGLMLSKIVIELTEHNVNGDMLMVAALCQKIKALGVKIAIDDVGVGASNLDRIGMLEPDILKVDIHALKSNQQTTSYDGVLYSLSLLARKIGAELLFEGIENSDQFYYSWSKNARYYQGYFFSKPQGILIEKNILKERFKKDIYHFIELERKKYKLDYQLSHLLNEKLNSLTQSVPIDHNLDEWLYKIAVNLKEECFRIYITDKNGYQMTSNGMRVNEDWMLLPALKGRNWSWRPFFIENLIRMDEENKGILSDVYSDIETSESVRTFSFPIDHQLYLFIDIR
ncbi:MULTISPECIES: EAL domain-containing protein [Bacillaceae]|uniref:EAL domain-containing protein n=1 Tax=Bacillaceae TaxID=186817 RepID=UPI000BFC40A5|nr:MULTISPECIES: EAL-associated domain-containing protein [Bacillaceae]PGT79427.1 diguanylate phosphodiesterase [Bacillus sp. AFS040349]UGB32819.1 EAL domain-containing protein [Metabacillus sp. B2-18]